MLENRFQKCFYTSGGLKHYQVIARYAVLKISIDASLAKDTFKVTRQLFCHGLLYPDASL